MGGAILTIILVVFGIGAVKGIIGGLFSAHNMPDLDENGDMRCKGCGGRNFTSQKNNDGTTTFECTMCGKRWTRY